MKGNVMSIRLKSVESQLSTANYIDSCLLLRNDAKVIGFKTILFAHFKVFKPKG